MARANRDRAFSSLHHVIDMEWMTEAYRQTRKDGAPGIDGVTAETYEAHLEANLQDLLGRIKSGRYVAPPVRRAYIPKADGSHRPLGIPTFEDKVAQRAIALAGINLQSGLTSHRAEQVKTLEADDGRVELRAVTGPDYGRIYDHELVGAVQRIAGDGASDTRWKVPGVLDWSTGIYKPQVDVTRDTTTLCASDCDVFLFLVDDLNPIEAGRLPDGSPDFYFRRGPRRAGLSLPSH